MRGHRYRQFLSFCSWLAIPILTIQPQSVLAEAVTPSSTSASAATAQESGPAQTALISSLSPDQQGDLLMAYGHYAAAIDAYQHGPLHSAVTWNKMGVAYHHLFALEEARKHYQMALVLDPRYSQALNNLGAVYHGEHKYGEAVHTYKKALKYSPNSAVIYSNLGTAYFAEKKYKNGNKAYGRAIALDPNVFNPDRDQLIDETSSREQRMAMDYYLAKAYAQLGKNEQALTYLRKALDAGFNDRRHLTQDKEFAQLRTTPEFHKLMVEEHLD
jgi:tetratricopeptide (TPR) repeat protein